MHALAKLTKLIKKYNHPRRKYTEGDCKAWVQAMAEVEETAKGEFIPAVASPDDVLEAAPAPKAKKKKDKDK